VQSCARRYGALYGNELGAFDMDLLTDGLEPILGTRSVSSTARLVPRHDFSLTPDDTSFLFGVPCMRRVPLFHLTQMHQVDHVHKKADPARPLSRLRVGTYRLH